MPCSRTTLTLSDAKRMLAAGEAEAASFGVAYNIKAKSKANQAAFHVTFDP